MWRDVSPTTNESVVSLRSLFDAQPAPTPFDSTAGSAPHPLIEAARVSAPLVDSIPGSVPHQLIYTSIYFDVHVYITYILMCQLVGVVDAERGGEFADLRWHGGHDSAYETANTSDQGRTLSYIPRGIYYLEDRDTKSRIYRRGRDIKS